MKNNKVSNIMKAMTTMRKTNLMTIKKLMKTNTPSKRHKIHKSILEKKKQRIKEKKNIKVVRRKYKEKVGKKKFLRLPRSKISLFIIEKKRKYFRLIREYFLLTKLTKKFKFEIKRLKRRKINYKKWDSILKYQEKRQRYLTINKILLNIKKAKRKKISRIIKVRKSFKHFRLKMNKKKKLTNTVPFTIFRKLKTVIIKGGELAGLMNKYYRPYYPNYRKLISRTVKRNLRKHYMAFMRSKAQQITLCKYMALWAKPGSLTRRNLIKKKKMGIHQIIQTLSLKKINIPPKYKRVLVLKKRIATINKLRYSKLQIPEFQKWSDQIVQQIHGKY